ncbi:hypothetical protein [Lentilactobacillus sp. SPB1-3]|uniref:Uncharacterized protein n=1 Tax=Lentilactobacillus terminaliae TaxID=3003483 RepID=A0ACD5DD81_9LACO|nr:hypothetical protein [Lentilactobacillus sp. SPB1-3]MCZ0978089.1 hypothetical protein [Lentilactobacillus sp. SPB1-3]
MIIDDFFEAIDGFSIPITVHPNLNVLQGGKLNKLNELVPIEYDDVVNDLDVIKLEEPVVPESSNAVTTLALVQSLGGGGNTIPRRYIWYSQHEFTTGILVEVDNHILQIDSVTDYNHMAGAFVYRLKGDDALEPTI